MSQCGVCHRLFESSDHVKTQIHLSLTQKGWTWCVLIEVDSKLLLIAHDERGTKIFLLQSAGLQPDSQ